MKRSCSASGALLEQKSGERDRVLALFRRGRIDDATLDKQLDEINAETIALTTEIDATTRALSSGDQQAQLNSAEALLKPCGSGWTNPSRTS